MTGNEIRSNFLKYFEKQGHKVCPSDLLVPKNDPTLLFTSAGMVQFKDQFLGLGKIDFRRAATCQKCFRTSDVENVGRTPKHHTFFEMLGNFSFGDYFKRESITWGWEFVTEVLGLPGDQMFITIYPDDEEAFNVWKNEVGIPETRIVRLKSSFWEMGPTGPCGPCSEIHMDVKGTLPKEAPQNAGQEVLEDFIDQCVEIWNHVFTQFDRQEDGSFVPLPQKNIDTGMGMERITSIVQGKDSNFETDLFMPIMGAIEEYTKHRFLKDQHHDVSFRVIADHIRAATFCLADGIQPSNEGRGYVLRRIIRRAVRHSRILGIHDPFMSALVPTVISVYEKPYPETRTRQEHIEKVLAAEEDRFASTLEKGLYTLSGAVTNGLLNHFELSGIGDLTVTEWNIDENIELKTKEDHKKSDVNLIKPEWQPVLTELMEMLKNGTPDIRIVGEKTKGFPSESKIISGETAFKLHDTYGFPLEVTKEIAEEHGFTVDTEKYHKLLDKQRERSREAWRGSGEEAQAEVYKNLNAKFGVTNFVGYEEFAEPVTVKVQAIVTNGDTVPEVYAGDEAAVLLDPTPFYGESGGQIGDTGYLTGHHDDSDIKVRILDCRKLENGLFLHYAEVEHGTLQEGMKLKARIDVDRRMDIMRNHSATHLLHAALREVLGKHVTQQGSLVHPDYLRFDFSHNSELSAEEMSRVEEIVNCSILGDHGINKNVVPYQQALNEGAMALFGEKYGDEVRMVKMGDVSTELCGGTHLEKTNQIGVFKIKSEGSIAAGVRRIEALTGRGAYEYLAGVDRELRTAAAKLKATPEEVTERIGRLQEQNKALEKEISRMKEKQAASQAEEAQTIKLKLADGREAVLVAQHLPEADAGILRKAGDKIKAKEADSVYVGYSEKVIIVMVGKSLTDALKAGDIIKKITSVAGGGGGGNPATAQAGGFKLEKIPEGIDAVVKEISA